MDACLGGKESMGQESNEVTFLENNFEGTWADADNMLDSLSSLDAFSMEDVDWHNLIENRSPIVAMPSWSAIAAVLFLSTGNGFLITN
ncbi:hypothetical protein GOBAR_AA26769 [Gossypium barbadense]|uniref:Uncharacterized protein n=1 Tax=Gossypium barbadense TaxID=3634 RepID=A0A2P5WS50_GOSBA|nr:hypothetical protein GOBAR_AA26769 [Gossypium barbadense]